MSTMRVVVMSKDGKYISTYEGISRVSPSYNGDRSEERRVGKECM